MSKPLVIELFCGMFGWSAGWLALGGEAIGFDIEHQPYHGPVPKGAHLVLQDVLTLHGSQFKDASLILASSPCQAYSYMAMPWSRAKQIARALRGQDVFPDGYEGYRTIAELNALFEAPKRIQREACEAAGRYIPMIQENVRGAIPWVGRSAWNFGSFHLWGDVPALMPITLGKRVMKEGVAHRANGETNFHGSAERAADGQKNPVFRFYGSGKSFLSESVNRSEGLNTPGRSLKGAVNKFGTHNMGSALAIAKELGMLESDGESGTKQGGDWFSDPRSHSRLSSSKSSARESR